MYLEVYDLLGRRLGILGDAYEINIEKELDTWPTLRFFLPRSSPYWRYILSENRIRYDNKLYVIKNRGVKRDGRGTPHQEIECPSIASDLNHKYNQVIGTMDGSTLLSITRQASVMLDIILSTPGHETGWVRGNVTIDPAKYRTFSSEWSTVPANLLDVKEKFGGYIVYNDSTRTVDLLEDIGLDRGVIIQYGKNITSLEKSEDSTEFVTRLYVYGNEDISIQSIPANGYIHPEGQSYIQNFDYFLDMGYTIETILGDIEVNKEASPFIKVGHYNQGDYVDVAVLYEDSKRELDTKLCRPKLSYTVSLVDLSQLSGFEQESFDLGDWVTVFDSDLGIDTKVQIVKMTEYPGFPEKTKVDLDNNRDHMASVLQKTIQITNDVRKSAGAYSLIKQRIINTFATTINSSNGKLSWSDSVLTATEIDAQGVDTGRIVRLSPGGLGISTNGGQTFNNAITGDGILANIIHVTDEVNLYSGDTHTRLTGNGLAVFDDKPTPAMRVLIGQFEPGQFGIRVNSGSIKVIGGLPNSEIGSVSASKLIGGTITATESIYLGDERFELNAISHRLVIGAGPTNEFTSRVILGKSPYDFNDYGIWVYNPDGECVFDASSINIGSNGMVIKTGNSGGRIVIDEQGFSSYDSSNSLKVRFKTDGDFIMHGGAFLTRPAGTRIAIQNNQLRAIDTSNTTRMILGETSPNNFGMQVFADNGRLLFDNYGVNPDFIKRFPNKIRNSGFEVFDGTTFKPTDWVGSGVSSPDSAWEGDRSLKLTPGQSMSQGPSEKSPDTEWWDNIQTRVSFKYWGGGITVEVVGETLIDNRVTPPNTGSSLTFGSASGYMEGMETFYFIPRSTGRVTLRFTNNSGSDTYVDAVQMEPDFTGIWPSYYSDGPGSSAGGGVGAPVGGPVIHITNVPGPPVASDLAEGDLWLVW